MSDTKPVTPEREAGRTETPNIDTLARNISKWIVINTSSIEFKKFKRRQMRYALSEEWERRLGLFADTPEEFIFPKEIDMQHDVIMAYFGLRQAHNMLSQCEYYFRRFPFRGTPVSRDDHARNVCEFYFGYFYIIRSRLKETLNKLKIACPNSIDVGKWLRLFDKTFQPELRTRNRVHHHTPFEDIGLDRILLPRLLASGEEVGSKNWERQHLSAYRAFSREWGLRARERARAVEIIIEGVSAAILKSHRFCSFHKPPPCATSTFLARRTKA